jgi:hypothetical protein
MEPGGDVMNTTQRMIIDEQLPGYDVATAVRRVVDADPVTTWRAARELDLLTVRTPPLAASVWLRGQPDRLRGRPLPRPRRLSLAGADDLPGWLVLGEREGSEVGFGAVGRNGWLIRPVVAHIMRATVATIDRAAVAARASARASRGG